MVQGGTAGAGVRCIPVAGALTATLASQVRPVREIPRDICVPDRWPVWSVSPELDARILLRSTKAGATRPAVGFSHLRRVDSFRIYPPERQRTNGVSCEFPCSTTRR